MTAVTKALIVILDPPLPVDEAEELISQIEDLLVEQGFRGHAEHWTQRRAQDLDPWPGPTEEALEYLGHPRLDGETPIDEGGGAVA